jgi:hypothetical protein
MSMLNAAANDGRPSFRGNHCKLDSDVAVGIFDKARVTKRSSHLLTAAVIAQISVVS